HFLGRRDYHAAEHCVDAFFAVRNGIIGCCCRSLCEYCNRSSSQGREQKTESLGHVNLLENAVTSLGGRCWKIILVTSPTSLRCCGRKSSEKHRLGARCGQFSG